MHITVIAKAPVPGRVKTRLCPPCSPDQAAAIARAGMLDTMDAIDRALTSTTRATRTLLLDGDIQPWMPTTWRVIPQRGHDLAERLSNGFIDLGPGIIIGMETPHVAGLLPTAVDDLLRGNDVLGPAEDGGYWAIGLCPGTAPRAAEVFAGIAMSTNRTGGEQLRRLGAIGTHTVLLPSARDLDDWADLCAVATSGRSGRLAELARVTVASIAADATMLPRTLQSTFREIGQVPLTTKLPLHVPGGGIPESGSACS